MTDNNLLREFVNPSARYRAKPFWAWNARLEADELRRQIRIFKEMGLGGFFMHSRIGLATPYLSREWFDMIKTCIDEARQIGMEAWLYDEDRWPSGAAGGLVTKEPQYRRKMLQVSKIDVGDFKWPSCESSTYVFSAVFEHERLKGYTKLQAGEDLSGLPRDAQILLFELTTSPNISWFNGYTYLDTLNPDAVKRFVEVTHEAYKAAIGKYFGNIVPGIFTDEPNTGPVLREWFHDVDNGMNFPWTDSFSKKFKELYHYEITDYLPEIIFDLSEGQLSKPRYHYHCCRSTMFTEAFAKQIGQWCDSNGLLFTGHVLLEEPPSDSVSVVGSPMQFYQYMQAPGVDLLTQYWNEYVAAKQCVSVARQTGRKWVLSEIYGCTGWETTFETYKFLGDWQAALGITLRCPHLSWYSMAGEAKRDYPASIHYHSPWYKQFRHVENYYSRLNTVLTEGQAVCDMIVIHPLESMYLLYGSKCQQNDYVKLLDRQIKELTEWLIREHVDFDFADEQLLIDLKTEVGGDERGPFIQVGQMRYRSILVPPLVTIRSTTLELLKKFDQAGGSVTFTGDTPIAVDAVKSAQAHDFANQRTLAYNRQSIVDYLSGRERIISIEDKSSQAGDVFCQLRRIDGQSALFLANTNRQKFLNDLTVEFECEATQIQQLQLWDCTDGSRYDVPFRKKGKKITFDLSLEPTGSVLVLTSDKAEKLPAYLPAVCSNSSRSIPMENWRYELSDYNVLVLDRAACCMTVADNKKMQFADMEILRLDVELRKHLGIAQRGGDMVQPWVAVNEPAGPSALIELHYHFNIEHLPKENLLLALEQPDNWKIEINEIPIDSNNVTGWWVDPAIRTLPIDSSALKLGNNTLVLSGQFNRKVNLELMHLLGDFGVTVDGSSVAITHLPEHLHVGSWVEQRLPFYSGNITYKTQLDFKRKPSERYFLHLPNFCATLIEARINGSKPLIFGFGSNKQEITSQLQDGRNVLELTLYGSRRNAFGPLHLTDDTPLWTGPIEFRYNPEKWQDHYKLIHYGLFEDIAILCC